MSSADEDVGWMDRALSQAQQAVGRTAPNPPVGAVVVMDGVCAGEGHTQPAGGPHAEVMAFEACRMSGRNPRGATLYVTLEPCNHHGRTPPCTQAIIDAGIARVVVGSVDPHDAVCGAGIARLRAAGVTADVGVRQEACERQVLGFASAVRFGTPEVTLKAAISLDGSLTNPAAASPWITGAEARQHGHRLRAEHDAIVVGIQTALADDPMLSVRCEEPARQDATIRPVVLDTHLRIPADAAMFEGPVRPMIICGERAPSRTLAADIVRVSTDANGRVSLPSALVALVDAGMHRVLIEGGAGVFGAALRAECVDTLTLYVAPTFAPGGLHWLSAWQGEGGGLPSGFAYDAVERVGEDVHLRARRQRPTETDPFEGRRLSRANGRAPR